MAKRIRESRGAQRERGQAPQSRSQIREDISRQGEDRSRYHPRAKYTDAVAILKNTRKAACEPLLKVLNSAAANAENNLNMNKSELYVAECYANAGPILKRFMPRAKGSAARINKRTSHITVILDAKAE